MLCVCVSIGAWADAAKFNVTHSGSDLTVNFDSNGTYTVSTVDDEVTNGFTGTLYITGTVAAADVEALITAIYGTGEYKFWNTSIDMSGATISDIDNFGNFNSPNVKVLRLPSNATQISSTLVTALTAWGVGSSALSYIIVPSCPVLVYASKELKFPTPDFTAKSRCI